MKCEQCEQEFERLRPSHHKDPLMVCNECFDMLRNAYQDGFDEAFTTCIVDKTIFVKYKDLKPEIKPLRMPRYKKEFE